MSEDISKSVDRVAAGVVAEHAAAVDRGEFPTAALAALRDGGWLTPDALLVVEEAKSAAFAAPDGFEELERRAYDDTEFVFLRAA